MTYKTEYADDIQYIQKGANQFGFVFDSQVDVVRQWRRFSEESCANWLMPNEYSIEEFAEFLGKQDLDEI